jgi:hypothetical protein
MGMMSAPIRVAHSRMCLSGSERYPGSGRLTFGESGGGDPHAPTYRGVGMRIVHADEARTREGARHGLQPAKNPAHSFSMGCAKISLIVRKMKFPDTP